MGHDTEVGVGEFARGRSGGVTFTFKNLSKNI